MHKVILYIALVFNVGSMFAMIGAILESKEGNVFVKFTGPEKDVDASQPAFLKLLGTAYPVPAVEAK